jgi:hypothetical protein
VVRLDKFGNLRGSIPCNICLLAMKGKIRRVYYSTDDGCIAVLRVCDVGFTYHTRSQREHKCNEKIKEYNF